MSVGKLVLIDVINYCASNDIMPCAFCWQNNNERSWSNDIMLSVDRNLLCCNQSKLHTHCDSQRRWWTLLVWSPTEALFQASFFCGHFNRQFTMLTISNADKPQIIVQLIAHLNMGHRCSAKPLKCPLAWISLCLTWTLQAISCFT